jgi:FkbM family methyltransferase
MAKKLSPLSAFWSFLGRQKQGPIPAWVGKSARRKFSRRERGELITCPTAAGFRMEVRIGDPLDNLIYFDGEFEPELRLLLAQLAPALSTVVDVGCNIGYVSCLLASLTEGRARLLSVDANPEMASRCESNLRLNGFPAEVCCCAAGRADEVRTFHIPKHRPSYASFGQLDYGCEEIEVPVRRLDGVAREKGLAQIDLLKIDVEGFEPEVLGGLGDLPVKNICLEFSPDNLKNCGFSPDDLWNLPLWKNYRLALLEKETARPIYFQPGEPLPNETEIVWAQALA